MLPKWVLRLFGSGYYLGLRSSTKKKSQEGQTNEMASGDDEARDQDF